MKCFLFKRCFGLIKNDLRPVVLVLRTEIMVDRDKFGAGFF